MGRRIAADGSISDGAPAPEGSDGCGPAWYAAVPFLGFFIGGPQGFLFGALISGFLYSRGRPSTSAGASADRQAPGGNVRGLADLPAPAPARGG